MSGFAKFSSLSPSEKARFISGSVFFLVYFGLGVMFLFVKKLPFAMPPAVKAGFGIILVAYSCFRLTRIVRELRGAVKRNVSENNNETSTGK